MTPGRTASFSVDFAEVACSAPFALAIVSRAGDGWPVCLSFTIDFQRGLAQRPLRSVAGLFPISPTRISSAAGLPPGLTAICSMFSPACSRPGGNRQIPDNVRFVANQLAERLVVQQHPPGLLHILLADAERPFAGIGLRRELSAEFCSCCHFGERRPLARGLVPQVNQCGLNDQRFGRAHCRARKELATHPSKRQTETSTRAKNEAHSEASTTAELAETSASIDAGLWHLLHRCVLRLPLLTSARTVRRCPCRRRCKSGGAMPADCRGRRRFPSRSRRRRCRRRGRR